MPSVFFSLSLLLKQEGALVQTEEQIRQPAA